LSPQKAANESRTELEAALAGADMVFVTVSVLANSREAGMEGVGMARACGAGL
jgi:cell division GTPase FtsZ